MRLQSVSFIEHEATLQEWALEGLSLGPKNLLVGKNATGKSRTLNVINALARHLSGISRAGRSSKFDFRFLHEGQVFEYFLHYEEQCVLSESLKVDGEALLQRTEGGEGIIYAAEIDGGKSIRFQAPPSEIAVVVRRDSLQHPFLEPLYTWASNLRHYQFGSSLGKDHLAVLQSGLDVPVDERDPNAVVGLFREADKRFGPIFLSNLKEDLSKLDYNVSEIGVAAPISFRLDGLPGEPVALYVKETDLPGYTDQHSMSQGMFRVLSLLIHLNYSQLKNTGTCVLVDDIGEGLDFDRSCRLIELLRSKAEASDIQVIMSTNDRFVMNNVPLQEWSVLQRTHNHVRVRNYDNSRELFEDFRFTGLSNFSFLEFDFLSQSATEK